METLSNGIILKETPFQEEDMIIEFLLESNDKIFLFAKSIQKMTSKNRHHLNLGWNVEVNYFPARFKTKVGRLKTLFAIDRFDFNTFQKEKQRDFFLIIIRQLDYLTYDIKIYNDILELLKLINKNELINNHKIYFLNKILEANNQFLSLDSCANCNSKIDIVSFDCFENGLLCKNCISNYNLIIEKNRLIQLIYFFRLNLNQIENDSLDPKLFDFLYNNMINFLKNNFGYFIPTNII